MLFLNGTSEIHASIHKGESGEGHRELDEASTLERHGEVGGGGSTKRVGFNGCCR